MQDTTERLAYKPAEAAKALGLGRTKLLELIASGRLRSVRADRRVLIPRSALEAFLEAKK